MCQSPTRSLSKSALSVKPHRIGGSCCSSWPGRLRYVPSSIGVQQQWATVINLVDSRALLHISKSFCLLWVDCQLLNASVGAIYSQPALALPINNKSC